MRAPMMPPTTCAIHETIARPVSIFFVSSIPSVTAGLMWQPLIGPITYAITSSERPNASATPSCPMSGARIAVPGPAHHQDGGAHELGRQDPAAADAVVVRCHTNQPLRLSSRDSRERTTTVRVDRG